MKNIVENNKMFAEFLGYCQLHPDYPTTTYWYKKDYQPLTILLFHSNWDWLMRVVEKIESLGYNIDTMKVDITKYQSSQFCGIYIDGKIIYTNYCETKIEAVYNACVEFVKWYNQQSKK